MHLYLFPYFRFSIDNLVDSIVSYRPIGQSNVGPTAYAQPRTRPAHLIFPDDDCPSSSHQSSDLTE